MKSVNRTVLFPCTKCPKQFSTKYGLKIHTNISHDDNKRYQCYFCSLAIFEESGLIQHMSKHTKEKPYKCQHCLQSYQTQRSVKSHEDGKICSWRQTFRLPNQCYFCDKVFLKRRNVNVHMNTVHLKEGLKRCNLCGKHFSSTTSLNHHITTVHLLERKRKCQLCSKGFSSNASLNRHIQSLHTKEKPLNSYFCSKSFVNVERLRKHMAMHTREKPLTCYFCLNVFSVVDNLSLHIRRFHTNERPFKCIQCPSRCYTSKTNLNAHVQKKHSM
jgi:KRAB domain-containing zinc finger protein